MKQACALTSLSRSTISRLCTETSFPAPVPLGQRRFAFVRSEIDRWITNRIEQRNVR
ncbi:helix-turn-helix transcriptional regulator [Bosea sp. MMO-172]|uniref:helix-turn-helix transcriptional regulator n=1 Tax=Bosea sp. MMO-172 TaxID=3127885 RepID=UPI003018C943